MNMRIITLLCCLTATSSAIDPPSRQVPVEIQHEKGSFTGQLSVAVAGTMNKAKAEWNATIQNTSPHPIFRVTFCIRAYDAADQQIRPGGNNCLLTLWGNSWQPGASLHFKGKQNFKINDTKSAVQVARYDVSASEVFDRTPNIRTVTTRCPLIWPVALRLFADRRFRPTVLDKDSLTATFAYDGGRIDGGASTNLLKAYTTANTALFLGPIWESFRVDNASLYLREEKPSSCTAEIKMSFAGFGKPFMGQYGWYAVESNFHFEKTLLDGLQAQASQAASEDLDKGVSQLPTEAPKPTETAANPQLTVTSEPSGAEIEINGEFIGNTPTTITTKGGSVVVKVKQNGRTPWERTLKLNPGDKRTLHADLQPNAANQ